MRQCPVLQAKKAQSFNTTAGASILAAPVPAVVDLEFPTDRPACASACVADREVTFDPFISDGFVSLVGGHKVRVKILRDTGASGSFILGSVLPFSNES